MNKLLEQAIQEVSALPEPEQEELAARLLDEVHRRAPRKGKWAEVADRLARLDVLHGRGDEFRRLVREFRDTFGFRDAPNSQGLARYLLDTNALSYLIDTASPGHAAVHAHLAALADTDEVALSVLSLYELHHWFAYDPAALATASEIIGSFPVLPLPEAGAAVFSALMRDLRPELGRADIQRHAVDGMIAATALDRGAVLVSNDALFGRLAGLNPALQVTDWTVS